ncbi:hypothetical protein G7Z17_g4256 [Cylindrodendrum hubeiense]|uniref:Uncharacterized protein n=1 Tax=Cylindrodendrum hubeiense TaxID=595255 RepID=A0A9P5LCT1_9HYPO|nr:hypothetical protein G7Z17_g4256 [Cylindrodendrum hubeiense]
MVSTRLRLVALATILCMFLFYTFSNKYDYSYPSSPKTQSWAEQSQTETDGEAKFTGDYIDSDVVIATPTGAGRGAIPTMAVFDQEPKEQGSSTDLEAQKPSSSDHHDSHDDSHDDSQDDHQSDHQDDHHEDHTGSTKGSESNATSHQSHDPSGDDVDWSRFAYTQYVTDSDYLCNSVMIFETLHRLGSKADRVMMYPFEMLDPKATESESEVGRLLIKSRDEYQVKLMPIEIQHHTGSDATWADSFTKLLAFNQTQYDRVLSLDSDGTILQHMDELFLLPPCPVAMPRAYWLLSDDPPQRTLSSQVMLIQPDAVEFDRIMKKMDTVTENDYDMEIVNQLYYDSALILPHRPYDMVTGEYRRTNHVAYLGSDREEWDPAVILSEAKFVHFSDWPIPKPWIDTPEALRQVTQPNCTAINGKDDCIEKSIWNDFYADFRKTRERVCYSNEKLPHTKRRHWLRLERNDHNE